MSQHPGGQPIIILRQGITRNRGQEARNSDIAAAKAVTDAVRSIPGLHVMDKILNGGIGDFVIPHDGSTIFTQNSKAEHQADQGFV